MAVLRNKVEEQADLEPSSEGYIDKIILEYLELIVQFGFVTLFAITFPLLPLIAYVTNICEVEVDKMKILRFLKRPIPAGALDIGNWFAILEVLSFIAIFSNLGILIFTSNNYHELTYFWKWIIYMVLSFFYIIVKIFVSRLIPDVPAYIIDIQKRHKHVINNTCNKYLDNEYGKVVDIPLTMNIYSEKLM